MRMMAWLIVGVFLSINAHAFSLHSVSGGYENVNALGTSAQKFNSPLGGSINAFIDTEHVGHHFQAVVSGQFLMLPFKGATGLNLYGFGGYVGLRTHPALIKQPSWLSPTFGILVGGMYTMLGVPASSTSTTINSGIVFATQVVPGFDIDVWRQFGIQVTFPVTFLFGTSSMVLSNQVASLRYEL